MLLLSLTLKIQGERYGGSKKKRQYYFLCVFFYFISYNPPKGSHMEILSKKLRSDNLTVAEEPVVLEFRSC